jgi:hypothetical protein
VAQKVNGGLSLTGRTGKPFELNEVAGLTGRVAKAAAVVAVAVAVAVAAWSSVLLG